MTSRANQLRQREDGSTAQPLSNGLQSCKTKHLSEIRRDKKRIADRVSQRQSRARTKNKIAELEAIVTELTSQSGNETCKKLMEELERSRTECLSLKKKLSAIASIAQLARSENADCGKPPDNGKPDDFHPTSIQDQQSVSSNSSSEISHSRNDQEESSTPYSAEGIVLQDVDDLHMVFDDPFISTTLDPALSSVTPGIHVISNPDVDLTGMNVPVVEPPFTESWNTCSLADKDETQKDAGMWQTVSETLMKCKRQKYLQKQHVAGDHDIAVRAVAEGWDTINQPSMGASWQVLRQIDQNIWTKSRKVDRLAVLSIMNMLLQCHLNPSKDNLSKVPAWYRPRPSQLARSHFYAIDFFVWPGLRERFVHQFHKYSDRFWSLMTQHFRFVWPYDFRDCYVHNHSTGEYQLSELFLHHLKDLACFTFCKDMFLKFPEFEEDIPTFMAIQQELSLAPSLKRPEHDNDTQDSPPDEAEEHEMLFSDIPGLQSDMAHSSSTVFFGGDTYYAR